MRILMSLATAFVVVLASACSSSSPSGPSGASGSLSVSIKDSPYSDAKALLVTFQGVSAHPADGEWQTLAFSGGTSRTCDLKRLEAAEDILGVGTIAAGQYTQLRLLVASAALYDTPSTDATPCSATMTLPAANLIANVEIPSGEVKLNRQFTVPDGGATAILLDFDGDRSVIATGNGKYRMTPVIGIVSVK